MSFSDQVDDLIRDPSEQVDDDLNRDSNNNDEKPLSKLVWTWKDVIWWRIAWVFIGGFFHLPYSIYVMIYGEYSYWTLLWAFVLTIGGGTAAMAANHRLWSHRSYKANNAYQILMMLISTSTFQEDIIWWVKIHRMHHKFAETDADPHNAKRGFFYSHCGWAMLREHPEVRRKEHLIDMSDIYANPVLTFQRDHYYLLSLIFALILPTYVPTLWGESLWNAFSFAVLLKYTYLMNCEFSVNSVAHLHGYKPYDKTLGARNSLLAVILSAGEGHHNYHHTFPQDYRSSEFHFGYNVGTMIIDLFALIGWVWDRKTVSADVIGKRKLRTGQSDKID